MKDKFNNAGHMPWNGAVNPKKDAAAGWQWYKNNNRTTDTPVIGGLTDTGKYKGTSGYGVLASDRWTPGVNDAWVQGGIDRRAKFKLVSPQTPAFLWDTGRNDEKVFARELRMLRQAGYKQVGDYMIPPKKNKRSTC